MTPSSWQPADNTSSAMVSQAKAFMVNQMNKSNTNISHLSDTNTLMEGGDRSTRENAAPSENNNLGTVGVDLNRARNELRDKEGLLERMSVEKESYQREILELQSQLRST